MAAGPRGGGIGAQAGSQEPLPPTGGRAADGTITLYLPWAVLCRDNAKYGVLGGRMILTRDYRTAKQRAHAAAEAQWLAFRLGDPLAGSLTLDAALWWPDSRRTRDAGNYRKLVTDALQGVAYHTDAQLVDERWRSAGVGGPYPGAILTLQHL